MIKGNKRRSTAAEGRGRGEARAMSVFISLFSHLTLITVSLILSILFINHLLYILITKITFLNSFVVINSFLGFRVLLSFRVLASLVLVVLCSIVPTPKKLGALQLVFILARKITSLAFRIIFHQPICSTLICSSLQVATAVFMDTKTK